MRPTIASTDQQYKEVEAVLRKRATSGDKPTDADLGPVYRFLLPDASSTSSSSSSPERHWFCPKRLSDLHKDAATYLIFLFAFRREGTSKIWVDALGSVVSECEHCARGFGIARRRFGATYMSAYPPAVKTNFFAAVDKWQIGLILAEHAEVSQPEYGSSSTSGTNTLTSLSPPMLQLLFAEPSLFDDPQISALLDSTVATSSTQSSSPITSLGLTPLLVKLLGSPREAERKWARSQLPNAGRRPLPVEEWDGLGVGSEVAALYTVDLEGVSLGDRWNGVRAILGHGCLDQECVTRGLLGTGSRSMKGIMPTLTAMLGSESDDFPVVLETFSLLLQATPTSELWSFDPSPELPHTLFSDVKSNPSFIKLIENSFSTTSTLSPVKGKSKEDITTNPLTWLSPFMLSLCDLDRPDNTGSKKKEGGFGEALAKVLAFAFQDMQHGRFTHDVRAAAATAGTNVITRLQEKLARSEGSMAAALASILDIHASFITTVAFRPKDHPLPTWFAARDSARQLLESFFRSDSRDLVESMLGLAAIANEERKRLRLVRLAKKTQAAPPPPAIPVKRLHHASVRKQLWSMAYNALLPSDPTGAAILVDSIATFSHLEKMDRQRSWTHDDLLAVVKEEDWVSAVRAINAGLQATRDNFSHAVEALAMQPDPTVLRTLWRQPNIPKSAITLLLSPAEDIHDPMISLIQQSFEDVDDRGDCFRIILANHPADAMDGLCDFLRSFIDTAKITPESCSLAKWLVRCFTDILDALCRPSDAAEPLLQSRTFLETFKDGKQMSRRVTDLWHLMTTSLAVIFRRTQAWAPMYDNETMVDWMRDALIFGRQMTEHIKAFEGAALGRIGASFGGGDDDEVGGSGESPAKNTRMGKSMVQKLQVVLADLVSWLRLTDVETLHQTFELIKTILGRISKTSPDVSTNPQLETTLYEIDKFSRRATKSYRTRLSDDLLSELSDLLTPFNLVHVVEEDEIEFVKEVAGSTAGVREEPDFKPAYPATPSSASSTQVKDAFFEMMKKAAGGKAPPASTSKSVVKPTKSIPPSRPQPKQSTSIDDFDDDFLSGISASDLDIIEKRAQVTSAAGRTSLLPPGGGHIGRPPTRPVIPASKLNINLVPKSYPQKAVAGTSFKTQVMKDLRKEHRQHIVERNRDIGGIVPKLPPASGLGTGLGAYTGSKRVPAPVVDSGSSASESSDDEDNKGLSALIKAKTPKKVQLLPAPERRPIKILGNSNADILRQQTDKRTAQLNIKKRLKPDLSPLFRFILSWNPDHTGPMAPNHPKFVDDIGPLSPVTTRFGDTQHYERVMLPLFLQELWSQTIKDQKSSLPVPVEISTRTYEDDFLDIELVIPGQCPTDFNANEMDIVVLRQPGGTAQPVFAKVQGFRRKFKDANIKLRVLGMMDQRELGGKSKWMLHKQVVLNTALREFAALKGLPYYESAILSDILAGRSATMPRWSDREVEDAKDSFDVNEPQARAILGAMAVEGFALIQGPPGTGKTKTISGLVGKFLSHRAGYIQIQNGEKPAKSKLLVCAPSNAAIDEVCKRLMNGVPSASGGRIDSKIVRIGQESSVNMAVKDVSLDSLVEARVASDTQSRGGGGSDYARIQGELDEVKAKIRIKQEELQASQGNDERLKAAENEYHALITRRTQLGQQSSKAKDAARDATRHLEGARRAARDTILAEADIICATLSGAGQESLAPYTFETVIIDEAAQAIEMSCLIPLKYGCKRCIMVGDPNQLPPTTFSTEAEKFHYNESLFVRIAKQSPQHVQLLSIQYRMHPFISELPSKVFYNGQLRDGPDMSKKTAAIWHERTVFGPYRFFNVTGNEIKAGTSTKNPQEALVAVELYRRLEADFGSKINLAMRIGVITMYREQLFELKRKFTEALGRDILEKIEFNTVDGFQGQEKDIIILSCVRSGPNLRTIGFLRDARRMNVALTRAKSSLFVIGNASTLERSDEKWRTIVGDARDRGFFIDYGPTTFHADATFDRSPSPVLAKKKKRERPASPAATKAPKSPIPVRKPSVDVKPSKASLIELKRKPSTDIADLKEKKKKPELVKDDLKPPKVVKTEIVSKPKMETIAPTKSGSSSKPSSSVPVTPKLIPSAIPPPPLAKVSAPPRPPEDVLFRKKKKKPIQSTPIPATLPNVRAALNQQVQGRR